MFVKLFPISVETFYGDMRLTHVFNSGCSTSVEEKWVILNENTFWMTSLSYYVENNITQLFYFWTMLQWTNDQLLLKTNKYSGWSVKFLFYVQNRLVIQEHLLVEFVRSNLHFEISVVCCNVFFIWSKLLLNLEFSRFSS